MVVALALSLGAAGCRKAQPAATGSIVFDSTPEGQAPEAFLATQGELIAARPAIEASMRKVGPDAAATDIEATRKRITVERRGKTSILEVRVVGRDLKGAASLCNALLDTYLVERMVSRTQPLLSKEEALHRTLEKLDGGPGADAFQRQIDELEVQRRSLRTDAHILEPCTFPTSNGRSR